MTNFPVIAIRSPLPRNIANSIVNLPATHFVDEANFVVLIVHVSRIAISCSNPSLFLVLVLPLFREVIVQTKVTW